MNASNDAEYIDGIEHVGSYLVIIKCERPSGTHAIFHLAASKNGQSRVKRTVSAPGESGEELTILWPPDSRPILTFESVIPDTTQSYNLKVL